jgi:hypothetical protein
MSDKTVRIIEPGNNVLATAQVAEKDGGFAGSIDLRTMPVDLLRRFEAYEEIVNGQMFSLLDETEEEIRALALIVVFDEGREFPVEDLQIYPSVGRVSFKLAPRTTRRNGPASYADTLDVTPQAQAQSRGRARVEPELRD